MTEKQVKSLVDLTTTHVVESGGGKPTNKNKTRVNPKTGHFIVQMLSGIDICRRSKWDHNRRQGHYTEAGQPNK